MIRLRVAVAPCFYLVSLVLTATPTLLLGLQRGSVDSRQMKHLMLGLGFAESANEVVSNEKIFSGKVESRVI